MTDRMKESLFSALGDVEGAAVLDLYAGSGALGLEALSRGADRALFVESSRDAIVKLNENIEATGFGEVAEVVWSDVRPTLDRTADERVSLIFVDPPYTTPSHKVVEDLEALVTNGFLADDGRIVLHRPAKEKTLHPFGLKVAWQREFGQSQLMIFEHEDEDDA
jgi:16S rRNA (guanine966-N2)-methyltransferase